MSNDPIVVELTREEAQALADSTKETIWFLKGAKSKSSSGRVRKALKDVRDRLLKGLQDVKGSSASS